MSEYAVIAQNDESEWDDVKGDLYNYPSTYKSILTPGCKIIYYKGRMTNKSFSHLRLSSEPHYFGTGIVGDSIEDTDSPKNDWYCEILDYAEFQQAVPNKEDGEYLEDIPESKQKNYWRFGVREVSKTVYDRILSRASLKEYKPVLPNSRQDLESFRQEGEKKYRYSSYYERIPLYREKAIEIHGLSCQCCGFNFEKKYGDLGKGFIHVHHNKPVSESGPTRPDPEKDMSVLCPNCHAMIHRDKTNTLSVEDLKKIINS